MKGKLLVATLLLTCQSQVAAAADTSEQQSKHAQKVLVVLGALGINNQEIKSFVSDMDTRVQDGYFNLAQTHVAGGSMTLHYQLQASDKNDPLRTRGGGINKMELQYTPDHSHFEAIVRNDCAMVGYKLKF